MQNLLLLSALLATIGSPADSIYTEENLDGVTVVGFKQGAQHHEALSTTHLSGEFINRNKIEGVRELTSLVPNLYMPDYGAKQNSPVFIRGIGSKINAPSIVMYVDGVPFFENNAFDITLSDISNITVLRGPQGSLYGRNAIGGVIALDTPSPLAHQGTRIRLGYGKANDMLVSLSQMSRLSSKVGLGISAAYHHNDGYFTNSTLGEKADDINNFTGRITLAWQPSNRWNVRLSAFADHVKQGGYPYGKVDALTGDIALPQYDSRSTYRRTLITSGLNVTYLGNKMSFNSQTSMQYTDDHQGIDQDFTPQALYFVDNKSDNTMFSQEFTLRSENTGIYQWVFGAFAFHQQLNKTVETRYLSKDYTTPKDYDIPTTGLALYHQSTVNIWRGLSATAGLRFDYEVANNKYTPYRTTISTGESNADKGAFDHRLEFNQLTPRLSLQYLTTAGTQWYAGVSRGYKTGGFNATFKTADEQTFDPEYNWNYEIGIKYHTPNRLLDAELNLFYIDWRNQQIAQTIPGLGNIQRNAGKSRSKGVELSMALHPVRNLSMQINYGYTHAKFTEYKMSEKTDYTGKYLPMVPQHTLMTAANYVWNKPCTLIDKLTFNANLTGMGTIYWREANTEKQDFYMLLGANIAAQMGKFTWEVWGKNLTNTDYSVYTFVSSAKYAQKGKPITFGTTLTLSL